MAPLGHLLQRGRMSGVRILVADDHHVARQQICHILDKRSDWRVCAEATDGVEALQAAQRCCPDVALLDIQMPGMSGIEAARQIEAVCPNTLILMESFHSIRSYVSQLQGMGIRGLVQKYRIGTDLIPAIDAVLHGGRYFHFIDAQAEGIVAE